MWLGQGRNKIRPNRAIIPQKDQRILYADARQLSGRPYPDARSRRAGGQDHADPLRGHYHRLRPPFFQTQRRDDGGEGAAYAGAPLRWVHAGPSQR